MAHASTFTASPDIRMPSVAMPKLRWPHLSQRIHALLMMAIMISPCFLSDTIGYWVMRIFRTADEIAEKQAPDTILTHVRIFSVACPDTTAPAAAQHRWAVYAAQQGWPLYPEAGVGCFRPDRNLHGLIGLTAFGVACPEMILSAADQRRWVAYTAGHHWTAYPQAGAGCVDP